MRRHDKQAAVLVPYDAARRRFLKTCAMASLALAVRPAFAMAAAVREKSLSFYNIHTGEKLRAVYWADGRYVEDGLAEIDYILRDHRRGEVHAIDRRLLDLLFDLHGLLDTRQPFHVISGYRSPATNRMLRAKSSGVAERSLHLVGRAIDIRVPGRRLTDLRRAAMQLGRGGVGYYPRSDFVHVDTGPVRYW